MLPYGIIARVQYDNIIIERENVSKAGDEKNEASFRADLKVITKHKERITIMVVFEIMAIATVLCAAAVATGIVIDMKLQNKI